MSTEENKTLVHRLMEEGFNKGDMAAVDQLLDARYANHDPRQPRPIESPEAMKGFIQYLRGALPDVRFVIEDTVAEGNLVTYRWTATGTQQGEFFGVPPTGRAFQVAGIIVARVADGRIAEEWPVWDALGMLQQLGAIPTPEAATA